MVAYVTLAFFLAIILGRKLTGFTGKGQGHFSPYLLSTVEGGAVALPLYLSIVGQSSNTVIFDLAGSIIAFLIIPILVAGASEEKKPKAQLAKEVISHPFVVAILLGLLFNFTGLWLPSIRGLSIRQRGLFWGPFSLSWAMILRWTFRPSRPCCG